MRRHIPWTDWLLVHLACWCRAHMSRPTAYHFDLEAHNRMSWVAARVAENDGAGAGEEG